MGQLIAFLQTWSAVKRYTVERGINPVDEVEARLKTLWGDPETAKVVKMPLFLIVRRKPE
jgi:hypothetical protein